MAVGIIREVAKLEFVKYRQVQVLEQTMVMEDGVLISTKNHRFVLVPGDDLTTLRLNKNTEALSQADQAIINAAWTPEVITAWEEFKASQS